MAWKNELRSGAADAAVADAVVAAVERLLLEDVGLLEVDAHERTITARLANYLAPHFNGWHVDVEYNRDGHIVKMANGTIVVPDVSVHRRQTTENLLVIEVKKSSSEEPDGFDLAKLLEYKTAPNLRYQLALFIKFGVGATPCVERVVWV